MPRSVGLRYDTEVDLLDSYVLSYMAVNVTSDASKYRGGYRKVWVEAKYNAPPDPTFVHTHIHAS